MNDPRYFELEDHIGIADDGSLEPLREEGLVLLVPSMAGGAPQLKPKRTVLRPFAPKTHPRMVRTNDPAIAAALLAHGKYREVDPPQTETRTRRKAAAEQPTIPGARTEA